MSGACRILVSARRQPSSAARISAIRSTPACGSRATASIRALPTTTPSTDLTNTTPDRSVDVWLWDGGHYRLMVHSKWTHIGMAYNEKSGINVGQGGKFSFPRPLFFK